MGNTDSVPILSQVKSAAQAAVGDTAGALRTQENFAYQNTFPVISQIASGIYAAQGKYEEALDLQNKFVEDLDAVVASIPLVGHFDGAMHYAFGNNKKGDAAMKSASRTTGVILGGAAGAILGGPVGSVAGATMGGALTDGLITDISTNLDANKEYKPHGYFAVAEDVKKAITGEKTMSPADGFDMGLMLASDAFAGIKKKN